MNPDTEEAVNQLQPKRHTALKRVMFLSGIIALVALIVVACGGGDSRQATETSATTLSTGSTALGTTTAKALAVPPGWVGRAPKPEYINGILVPPEPAPTLNNATLAGVDSNSNGVRDDVERVIAQQFGGTLDYQSILAYAKAFQAILIAPTPLTRSDALAQYSKVMCATKGASLTVMNFGMTNLVVNTTARKAARSAFADVLGGGFSPEELVPCIN